MRVRDLAKFLSELDDQDLPVVVANGHRTKPLLEVDITVDFTDEGEALVVTTWS